MAKHTPGPWQAGLRTVTAPETEDRLALDVRLYGGNHDDRRANARLIATAPELLEALREYDDAFTEFNLDSRDSRHRMRMAAIKARAAIAKATGSAS